MVLKRPLARDLKTLYKYVNVQYIIRSSTHARYLPALTHAHNIMFFFKKLALKIYTRNNTLVGLRINFGSNTLIFFRKPQGTLNIRIKEDRANTIKIAEATDNPCNPLHLARAYPRLIMIL